MNWENRSGPSSQVSHLQAQLKAVQEALAEVESELSARLASISAFERRVEARLGKLTDELEAIEAEISELQQTIARIRDEQLYGEFIASSKSDARRTWNVPPPDLSISVDPFPATDTETQIKRLYRQLARLYHPDLATNDSDLAYRNEVMAAVNHAYATRNLAELKSLALGTKTAKETLRPPPPPPPKLSKAQKLQMEVDRSNQRLQKARTRLNSLHNHPSVKLSLDVKLARHEGRDLLGEMAVDLRRTIARKTAERDYLKSQLEYLNPK